MSISLRLALLLAMLLAAALAPRLGWSAPKPADRSPLKVAILDTGLDLAAPHAPLCADGHRDYTGGAMGDTAGHGTHVASTIARYAGAKALYCLMVLKVFGGVGVAAPNQLIAMAMHDAAADGADIINLSFGGSYFSEAERLVIGQWPRVAFVVAAGNDARELGAKGYWYYPAGYGLPNIRVVGALDANGRRASYSNYGTLVKFWQLGAVSAPALGGVITYMEGTSMATAVETGLLIKRLTQGR